MFNFFFFFPFPAQLTEIRSTGRGADTPHRQLPADLVAGSERCAREEAILLRGLPRQHVIRSDDCQVEG